jgi:GT2 family glycosyltransferase
LSSPLPEPSPTNVDVSILITNWNGREILRDALRSLFARTAGVEHEVIVVDDASSDGSSDMVRTEFPQVRLIVNPVNTGFVGANNLGVKSAKGRYILLLNSDTVLINDAVSVLARHLDTHPESGICGGWLLNRDLSSQLSFGSFPSLSQALVDALFLNDLFPAAGLPNRARAPLPSCVEPVPVDYVSGACLMARHEVVRELGLFDDRFKAYCEEVDLCRRVSRGKGLQVVFVPEARIIHLGGVSYRKLGREQIRQKCRGYDLYFRKHHGALYSIVTRLLYAWHYAGKTCIRLLRCVLSNRVQRIERRDQFLEAWHSFIYSLFPGE